MTKLLQEGIDAVRNLPADRQNMAGELLLDIAGRGRPDRQLTAEQMDDLKIALAQADREEFATDGEIEAVWKKFGL